MFVNEALSHGESLIAKKMLIFFVVVFCSYHPEGPRRAFNDDKTEQW